MHSTEKKQKILLVSMPWAPLDSPSIQLGILKSVLNDNGILADDEYLSLRFAAMIGVDFYNVISTGPGNLSHILLNDWLFNANLKKACRFPSEENMSYLDFINKKILKHNKLLGLPLKDSPLATHFGDSYKEILKHMKYVQIPQFMQATLQRIDFTDYDIVGFTCSLNQDLPSMAMAKEIKKHYPNIITIVGGASFDGEAGPSYLKGFPFIDFCIQGEGEITLPKLVKTLRTHKCDFNKSLRDIPGLCWRNKHSENHETIIVNSKRLHLTDLNQSPIPDYSSFYSTIKCIKEEDRLEIKADLIAFESSRGCWWGKCSFCGLNREHKRYRRKSGLRVLNEILSLSAKYKKRAFYAVDNVLDHRYFKDLLPELKEKKLDLNPWYFIRSQITKPQIKLLSDAGIKHTHAGIESLHSGLLKLMNKGTLAIENIQLMKWCHQYKIKLAYNLLFGFPGEKYDFYMEMLLTMEKIKHLTPPNYPPIKMQIVRFGKYFNNPEEYGIRQLEPLDDYAYAFPENVDLSKIALFFNPTFSNECGNGQYAYSKQLTDKILEWRETWNNGLNGVRPRLVYATGPDFLVIYDTRSEEGMNKMQFEDIEADIYKFCDNIQSIQDILDMVSEKYGQYQSNKKIEAILDGFIDQNIMISEGNKYLSLAVTKKAYV